MSRLFEQLQVALDEDLQEKLQWLVPHYSSHRVLRQAVDARRSQAPHWVYTVEVFENGETPPQLNYDVEKINWAAKNERPLIIGSGPAGLFAAIRLAERGIPCVLLERGSEGPKRIQAINRHWRYGELDTNNNVCFGEGGAGLYSDGKLITRIKSPHIPYVMDRLVRFGAPEEIRYLSNPHVGSDRIRRVIPLIRRFLQSHGCEIHFDTPMTRLLHKNKQVVGVETATGKTFHSSHIILATGHSAEDVLEHLHQEGVAMEGKSFALGLRIEHPQPHINRLQYRQFSEHPSLGSANYRLAHHDSKTGIGVYSFCMCPGGYVLSSGTSTEGVVANGMSNYHRNSPFANAAIVISIDHTQRFGTQLFGGLQFRRALEKQAQDSVRQAGGQHQLPVQRVVDFLENRAGPSLPSSCPSGVVATRLDQLLPSDLVGRMQDSLLQFNRNMKGFISPEAQFHGVESRTSCPVRVTRDETTLQSLSHSGLYPCGEGAGYAGGITSAACDGIRVAEAIVATFTSQTLAP